MYSIPRKIEEDDGNLAFASLCNRTEFNCSTYYYCPNKDESCEGFTQKETYFFCDESKTCIPNGKDFKPSRANFLLLLGICTVSHYNPYKSV